jgi:phosphoribosylglycinamide formyltransferase 2
MHKKILLLGSGELGKELVICLKQLGQTVVAADHYAGAPAMQVADDFAVLDMLDADALDALVQQIKPGIIIPEIEAIRTERFYHYEANGIQVVPSAKAANYTMNRKLIRDLAAKELGLRTANYNYAASFEAFEEAVNRIGIPCVVKPLMSSSGKGQSVLKNREQMQEVWEYAVSASRGDIQEVIIEEFIDFYAEITLLTVTQKNGPTLFCKAIGHRQERGDYQESWQPAAISELEYEEACMMSLKITEALTGTGIWGVEFFLTRKGVYFSELSPRPHDTGMVTLAGTQNFSEFELHARAVLGIPIPEIRLEKAGASAVLLAHSKSDLYYFTGIETALNIKGSGIRLFGKPAARPYRRMGVVLFSDLIGTPEDILRDRAKSIAGSIQIGYGKPSNS